MKKNKEEMTKFCQGISTVFLNNISIQKQEKERKKYRMMSYQIHTWSEYRKCKN